jgi:hypothetical protein
MLRVGGEVNEEISTETGVNSTTKRPEYGETSGFGARLATSAGAPNA